MLGLNWFPCPLIFFFIARFWFWKQEVTEVKNKEISSNQNQQISSNNIQTRNWLLIFFCFLFGLKKIRYWRCQICKKVKIVIKTVKNCKLLLKPKIHHYKLHIHCIFYTVNHKKTFLIDNVQFEISHFTI